MSIPGQVKTGKVSKNIGNAGGLKPFLEQRKAALEARGKARRIARETQGATPPTLQPKKQTETTDEAKKKKKTLLGGFGGGGGGGLKTTLG